MLELAALAADLSIDDITNLGLEPDVDQLLVAAMDRLYVNAEKREELFRHLRETDLTSDGLVFDGHLGNIKGSYFEGLVADRLNSGEEVGELQLGEGQTAVLADSTTQPGWDMQILNADGEEAETLQDDDKATESKAYNSMA